MLPLLGLFFSSPVVAKELQDTPIGIGINTWYTYDAPCLSVRYVLPTNSIAAMQDVQIQVEGLLGTSITPSTRSSGIIGGRILSAVVIEDNLNILAGAGVGLGVINKTTVFQLQPSMEAQYFLFGLENLSFSSGLGVNITLGTGENSVATAGSVFGGFNYWF
jgi:hypothetical protein